MGLGGFKMCYTVDSQSQDPISSRVYSESTKPFNAASSCRRLTNLHFISVTSCSNPTVSRTSYSPLL